MRQQRQFRTTEFTRLQVLLHHRKHHRRKLLRAEGEQGRRPRTSGRLSERELFAWAVHLVLPVSLVQIRSIRLPFQHFLYFSSAFSCTHPGVKTCCSFFKLLLPCLASVMSQPGLWRLQETPKAAHSRNKSGQKLKDSELPRACATRPVPEFFMSGTTNKLPKPDWNLSLHLPNRHWSNTAYPVMGLQEGTRKTLWNP